MHEIWKSGTQGESIIYKEWISSDNKEQGLQKQNNKLLLQAKSAS
jgi:hypothetical protein